MTQDISQKKKILVVDDEKDLTALVSLHMKMAGYEVLSASNGEKALVVARQEKPFATADDLLEIKGIGPKMLEALRPYVKVDGDSDLHAMASDSAQASAASVQP